MIGSGTGVISPFGVRDAPPSARSRSPSTDPSPKATLVDAISSAGARGRGPRGAGRGRGRGGSVDGGGGHARARISRISRVSCVSRVSKSPLESCHPLCLPQNVTRDETIASAIASTAGSHAASRFRASSRRSDGGFAVPGRVLGRGGARRRFGFHHEPTHGIRRRRVGGAVVAYVPGGV